jgi:diadenosine tetraphosphate (Ap4A) HIT family hydrolase
MLSKKQADAIKQQLIQQINATFPEDKKAFATSQLQGMSPSQLVEFLRQNKMISEDALKRLTQTPPTTKKVQMPEKSEKPTGCIFCSIANNEMPSFKIDENKSAVAVLELNPISKGHAIIIPKEHIPSHDRLPQQSFSLAKKISRKLKSKLRPKPKDVEIAFTGLFGHEVINVFPVYKNETISSGRYKEDKKVLETLQKKLKKRTTKKKRKVSKKKKAVKKKSKAKAKTTKKKEPKTKLWLPRRIP